MSTRRALLPLALGGVVLVLALAAQSAQAVITHLRNGKALSYMPLKEAGGLSASRSGSLNMRASSRFDEFFSNLDYNGGPVMPSNTNYAFYWRPSGAPAYPAGYEEGVNRYLEDLAHDSGGHENVDSVATQYGDREGHFANYESHFGGAIVDEDPYPPNGCTRAAICLTDKQLHEELSKYVKAHGLPTDLAHEYFLLTPPKVEDCFEAAGFECSAGVSISFVAYCAYHNNVPQSDGSQLIYANDPFVGSGKASEFCDDPANHPNGISDSALIGGLSHEHNESTTDPEPDSAWADIGGIGGENGDKCRNVGEEEEFGEPVGEEEIAGKKVKYNQVINGHHYFYQQEWSNKGRVCLQRLTFSAAELPAATFTSKNEGAGRVRFDATGSSAGAVRYNWQFNDGPAAFGGLNEPVETTKPFVEHEFEAPGTYLVALTVFLPDGTSTGTAKFVTTPALEPVASPPTTPTTGAAPPPSAPPPPPPALTASVAVAGTTIATRSNGRAKIKLTCTGTAPSCGGEALITVKQVVRVKGHKQNRNLVIGSARFTIKSGGATTITVKLKAAGKRLLRLGHGKLKAVLSVKQTSPTASRHATGVRLKLVKP